MRNAQEADLINSNIQEVRKMAASKCPVCDWEIKDGGVKVTVAGKEITVCCDECATQAIADHEKATVA